jgi:hypothetical protein
MGESCTECPEKITDALVPVKTGSDSFYEEQISCLQSMNVDLVKKLSGIVVARSGVQHDILTALLVDARGMNFHLLPINSPDCGDLGWTTTIELEVLLDRYLKRNGALMRELQASEATLKETVDHVHETVTVCEVIDSAVLRGLQLRRALDSQLSITAEGRLKVQEQERLLAEMGAEEEKLIGDRKQYLEELAKVRKQILKYKAKYEEVSHHVNVFSTGMDCVSKQQGPEEMRCSFNELRRVNATMEERLVLAGVSKQKVMKDLRDEMVEIRMSCSRNPLRSQSSIHDESLEDLHLTSQILKDMNEVWKAQLPSVEAVSRDDRHSYMLSYLASSLGYFSADCIEDSVDLLLSKQEGDHVEERAKLFGVLSVETHRYRSICGALQSAIKDSEILLDPGIFASVGAVISESCKVACQRLGCQVAFIWRVSHGSLTGYSNVGEENPLTVNCSSIRNIQSEKQKFFKPKDPGDNLGPDVLALISNDQLKNLETEHETFSIIWEEGGMTVVRDCSRNPPFHQFAGIYCEQFHRRVVSAIAPMQLVQIRRVADKRPLDLVNCLFELRAKASTARETARLANKHLATLFRAQELKILIPVESEPGKALRLSVSDSDESEPKQVQMPELPKQTEHKDAVPTPHETDVPEIPARIVFPVIKGRQVDMILEWTNPDPTLASEGFNDIRMTIETLFQETNADHKSILLQYANALECFLARWYKSSNSALFQVQELTCYETEDQEEEEAIEVIMRQVNRK